MPAGSPCQDPRLRAIDAPLPGVPLRLYLGREPAELLIESDWFPPRLIRVLANHRTLELVPGQVVSLRLDPSSAPLAWPFRFEASLARLRVPRSGEHDLELHLVLEGLGHRARRALPVTPARISASSGELLVTPEPEALSRALAELEPR